MDSKNQPTRIFTKIWRLAWPQTAMMFFHFLIGFIDVYVAGRLSDQVQASLGIITQTLFFLLMLSLFKFKDWSQYSMFSGKQKEHGDPVKH